MISLPGTAPHHLLAGHRQQGFSAVGVGFFFWQRMMLNMELAGFVISCDPTATKMCMAWQKANR